MIEAKGWAMFPTGRWASTMQAHGGTLVMHAFTNGAWAETRSEQGGKMVRGEYQHLTGSGKGCALGEDLECAMELAKRSAEAIAENERIQHVGIR